MFFFGRHIETIALLTFIIACSIIYFLIKQKPLLFKRVGFLIIVYILVIINYALIYSFLPPGYFSLQGTSKSQSLGFFESFYFSATTISTAGFGDICPIEIKAKLFAISEILLGIMIFIIGFGYILSGTYEAIKKPKKISNKTPKTF
ncbi:hypothetical protein KKC91_07535 [bacterium]|nr:hypothetical protein [bacterium]